MSACGAEWNERLSAWIDGEAAPAERKAVEAHLAGCAACASAERVYRRLGRGLAAARRPAEVRAPRRRRAPFAVVAAAVAAAAVFLAARPHGLSEALADDLERHHFRSFAAASPCEFTSSDRQQVRDWLGRAVGYDVPVPVIDGATLLGARRCKLRGVPTAALLYRHAGAGLTIFIAGPQSAAEAEASRLGQGNGRCAQGRLGEPICALRSSHRAALAVGEFEPEVVLAAARRAVE